MNISELPSKGRLYSSGEANTELHILIDNAMEYKKARCDCDSQSRCSNCIIEQELRYRKELLKKKVSELIDKVST